MVMALGAFFVVAIGIAACGSSGLSSSDVAKVGGSAITKADFNHWIAIAAKSGAQQGGGSGVVPDPPNYTNCIAALRKSAPAPKKGQTAPTDASFLAQCKQQYKTLIPQVVGYLISAKWIEGEAKDQSVSVSDAEVNQQLALTKKQAFPTAKAYATYLQTTGMGAADVLFRIRIQALSQKIQQKVTKTASTVSNAQVSAYYAAHKAQFLQPERRDIQIVLAKTQAKASAAKAAIQGGMSFAAAAKKYSIDPQTKAAGGVLKGVTKGQEDAGLDKTVFSAKKGVLLGPSKTQFGWYIVRVTAISAPHQRTLAESQAAIRQQLTSAGSQKALTAFVTKFQKKWQAKTNCAKEFLVPTCKGAPKPKAPTAQQQSPPPSSQGTTTAK
jgi:foldase protein PrsA